MLRELRTVDVAVHDVDSAEDDVVESSPHRRSGFLVGLVAVAGEPDGHRQDFFQPVRSPSRSASLVLAAVSAAVTRSWSAFSSSSGMALA